MLFRPETAFPNSLFSLIHAARCAENAPRAARSFLFWIFAIYSSILQILWYNGYICSMSFDEFELCIYAVGNIKGTLYIAYQAVLEVNRNDISSELRKYVNDDIQLSAIIEYMGYDEGVLHEHEGNVFFVNESNWLIARLVNHMTGEIVQDDIILDSGSITDVLNSRDTFFDYIFGTENH